MSAPVKGLTECRHRWVSVKKGGEGVEPSAYWRCRLCGEQRSGWWEPIPVPVVNEYEGVESDVEKIARQLHAQHQDEPVWDKLEGGHRNDYYLSAARVLQCPSVAAAFEAQAKLEALLAGEGDLPEGWTEEWRVKWNNEFMDPPTVSYSAWSTSADFVEVVRKHNAPVRIVHFERSVRSPAVRVEEGES